VLSLVPRLSTWRYPHLLLSAGACSRCRSTAGTRRPQLPIDICCRRSAANLSHAAAAVDRRDRQADGRTPDRYIEPAPHITRTASIIMVCLLSQIFINDVTQYYDKNSYSLMFVTMQQWKIQNDETENLLKISCNMVSRAGGHKSNGKRRKFAETHG